MGTAVVPTAVLQSSKVVTTPQCSKLATNGNSGRADRRAAIFKGRD